MKIGLCHRHRKVDWYHLFRPYPKVRNRWYQSTFRCLWIVQMWPSCKYFGSIGGYHLSNMSPDWASFIWITIEDGLLLAWLGLCINFLTLPYTWNLRKIFVNKGLEVYVDPALLLFSPAPVVPIVYQLGMWISTDQNTRSPPSNILNLLVSFSLYIKTFQKSLEA